MRDFLSRVRVWLRRVMPRVAVAAGGALVVWAILARTPLNETAGDNVWDVITFCLVLVTAVYYLVKVKLWIKRRLFWRVRRRLIITYLSVGLTPLILLGLLGGLAWLVISGQAMSRVVNVQFASTEKEALAHADALASDLLRTQQGANAQATGQWLDERVRALQPSLPGARVAVWRGGAAQSARPGVAASGEDVATLGAGRPADFLSADDGGEETRGVGRDAAATPAAPLPAWLDGRAEWSGFSFIPTPDDATDAFGTPSIRALVRKSEGGRSVALLVVVPVSRALVRQFQESTGIALRPYFLGTDTMDVNVETDGEGVKFNSRRPSKGERGRGLELDPDGQIEKAVGNVDQFGEPLPKDAPYVVVLPSTRWSDGERDARLAFLFDYSWAEARKQLLTGSAVGEVLQRVLLYVAAAFLVLELLALLAAGWMTRAVTGTVHKLYVATEHVKRGDFSHRIRVRSHDQLGELAEAFNEMSANIEALLVERVERERLEREVEIAHEVQAQLFPRNVPRLASAEIAGECRAARGVAGDYYDYVEVESGLVALALGDVSGKGVPAALVMSNLQASLRAQVAIIAERRKLAAGATVTAATTAATTAAPVADAVDARGPCGVTGVDAACAVENMVSSINHQLCQSTDDNRFATLFLALYDDRARRLRYTNAGHNAPIVVRSDGRVERLTEGGTIVGVFDFVTYEESEVRLAPGDLLVVFSDGISEAQNAVGEEYGEDRLARLAAANRDQTADDLRQTIFDEVDRWTGAEERGDDQTLVIMKVGG